MKKSIARFSAISGVVAVLGVVATATVALAGPKVCPQIYAPVICDNGRVYPNQCYADRNNARNCVPYNQL